MFEQLESRQMMSATSAIDAGTTSPAETSTTTVVADKKMKGSTQPQQTYLVVKLETVYVSSYQ
jgi:hypothetical protein